MKISDVKVGTRMGLSFGAIILFAALLGIVAIININTLANLTTKLYRHPYAVSTATLRIEINIARMHRSMKDVALASSKNEIMAASAKVAAYEEQVLKEFGIIEDRFLGEKEKVDEAKAMFVGWKIIRDEVIKLSLAGNLPEAAAITKGKGADYVKNLDNIISTFIVFANGKAESFVLGAKDKQRSVLISIIILTVLVVLVGFLFAFFLSRDITGCLKQIVKVSERMVAGDLNQELNIMRGDEFGNLLKSLNEMIKSWRLIVQKILDGSTKLSSSSTQIAASTEEMSRGAGSQMRQIIQTSSGMEEMSGSIQEVSRNARSTSDAAVAASSRAREGSAKVNETVGRIGLANESVKNLNLRAQEIGKVIQLIGEIAAQTNILALNAAIEAARAGEHGRGFDVVAEEIRKLAQRTAQSTEEISASIEEIQRETGESVRIMEEGTAMASEAGQVLEDIVEGIVSTTDMVQMISSAAGQQAKTAEDIANAVQSISGVSKETTQSSREVAKSTQDLSMLAEQLQNITKGFKV